MASFADSTSSWLIPIQPGRTGSLRLVCLAHAGGSAAVFRDWSDSLPRDVEVYGVQLPGRGARRREPAFERMTPLVEALGRLLLTLGDKPLAFFGHSMGGLVAFELAREMRRRGARPPCHLFVAGSPAPHLPSQHAPIHELPQPDLLDRLRGLDGTAPAVLDAPELMEAFLPTFRADLAVVESYACSEEPPLEIPISVFGGRDDPFVERARLLAWRDQTVSRFTLRILPGGHFFLATARARLLGLLERELEARVAVA